MFEDVVERVAEIIQESIETVVHERVGKDLMKEHIRPLTDVQIDALARQLVERLNIRLK